MRLVKTHIYFAKFGASTWALQKEQILEKEQEGARLADEWREQQEELADARAKEKSHSVLPVSKAEAKHAKKRAQLLKKSVAALVGRMQEVNDDIEMLNEGMLFVGTGVPDRKTGAEKQKLVPIWNILPDQAVYNATWADEQSKRQVDDILKGMSVHANLLEDFHEETSSLGRKLRDEDISKILQTQAADLNEAPMRCDHALASAEGNSLDGIPSLLSMMKQADASKLGGRCPQSDARPEPGKPAPYEESNAEPSPLAEVPDGPDKQVARSCVGCYQPSDLDVECSSGHFVCTGCILMLISVDSSDLERLKSNGGLLSCPMSREGSCEQFCPELMESTLRRASLSAYEQYRNLRRRAHKLQELLDGAGIPAHWTDAGGDKYAVRRVALSEGAQEFGTVAGLFGRTCRRQRIVGIERIQNLGQWRLYQERKRAMAEKNGDAGCNEQRLFHGTHAQAVPRINADSFNRSYCGRNATAYGRGVYFARDASYSASDTYSPPDDGMIKHVYLARVLVGVTAAGDSGMVEPPPRPDGRGSCDSTRGPLGGGAAGDDPSIVVVYHDAQAYAEYLIRFLD